MTDTNATFAQRHGIDPANFAVVRREMGTVQMSDGPAPRIVATIIQQDPHRVVWTGQLNATLLCLPDRHVNAVDATDQEIVLAILGDEPIFDY